MASLVNYVGPIIIEPGGYTIDKIIVIDSAFDKSEVLAVICVTIPGEKKIL